MTLHFNKLFAVLLIIAVLASVHCRAQQLDSGAVASKKQKGGKWFIVLPLRFTQLQNDQTMLSGIKFGKSFSRKVSLALSVYHSFYFESFKSPVHIAGFKEPPRLFINCVGAEVSYTLWKYKNETVYFQLHSGWGFVKYDLKTHEFKSQQVNYIAFEPTVLVEHKFDEALCIGLGLGFRPIMGGGNIRYTSAVSDGTIPVYRKFPNGIQILLELKGIL